jgi:thiol:disulfide interchange protein
LSNTSFLYFSFFFFVFSKNLLFLLCFFTLLSSFINFYMHHFFLFSVLTLMLFGCQYFGTTPNDIDTSAVGQSPHTQTEGQTVLPFYESYTPERLEALRGQALFAVFFHADWCSTCHRWKSLFEQNAETMPQNTLILEADFDQEKELAQLLGVRTQSTLVLFDQNGDFQLELNPPLERVIRHFNAS